MRTTGSGPRRACLLVLPVRHRKKVLPLTSSDSSNSSIVKEPNVSVLEPEKDHPKSTTQQIEICPEKIELIEINVGGKLFITTKPTIENTNIKYSNLIDRNQTYFDIILKHLRYQQQKCHISLDVLPNTRRELACVSLEAKFYGLNALVKMCCGGDRFDSTVWTPKCGDFWEIVFSSGSAILRRFCCIYVLLGNPICPG
ncbi:hypothetical protein DPMN_190290 [Dreissena polymorpha]|uniref:Potassium channel tetramerisation-type BTB domain-containing protein n=1 Tax=Dreissena polymorpha TaxID=45954 RepID=A0A9D4ID00_DREPO|nr:hypothetical protein DPMN_190290 [Dreissena polymorpha]